MKKYISKEYVNNILQHHLDCWYGSEYYACSVIQDEIDDAPYSEIICFQSGTWEYWAGNLARCPVCGYEYTDYLERDNFCGNCGADMRSVDNGRT